ncbi:SRPBCC domain-containing protein [Microbacterium sp. CFBP9034]|uniref:SRPBCC family protein n=1 Tax=Microbacterium sp. CFBP9034 TaxID=3096540 RepID=UPI002A6A16FC|nr:SRPBCC domain-containing protein [Microbacterium sp. CFBP9034]MDY0910046.1 SRPBCC domain-containing protein [Microbacterium sp. CFBP9034]
MFEMTEIAAVAASVDEVWADLTDASRLAAWIWPARFETEAVVEPVELGRWEVRSSVADLAVLGRVTAIEPPHRLRLEWRWEGEQHATDAELTLESAADASTRLTVRHTGFLSDDERVSHVEGWTNCLQRLVDRHGGAPGATL